MQASSGLPQQRRKKPPSASTNSPYLHPSYAASSPSPSSARSPSPSTSTSHLRLNSAFSTSAPYLAHGDYLHHGQPTLNPPANFGRMRPAGTVDGGGAAAAGGQQKLVKKKGKRTRQVDPDIMAAVMGVGLSPNPSPGSTPAQTPGAAPPLLRSTSSTFVTPSEPAAQTPASAPTSPPAMSPPALTTEAASSTTPAAPRQRQRRGRPRTRPGSAPSSSAPASTPPTQSTPQPAPEAQDPTPPASQAELERAPQAVFDDVDYSTAIYDLQNPPPHFTVPSAPAPTPAPPPPRTSSPDRSEDSTGQDLDEARERVFADLPTGWGVLADGRTWSPPPHYVFVSRPASPISRAPRGDRERGDGRREGGESDGEESPPSEGGDMEGDDGLERARGQGWEMDVPLAQRVEIWRRRRRREEGFQEDDDTEPAENVGAVQVEPEEEAEQRIVDPPVSLAEESTEVPVDPEPPPVPPTERLSPPSTEALAAHDDVLGLSQPPRDALTDPVGPSAPLVRAPSLTHETTIDRAAPSLGASEAAKVEQPVERVWIPITLRVDEDWPPVRAGPAVPTFAPAAASAPVDAPSTSALAVPPSTLPSSSLAPTSSPSVLPDRPIPAPITSVSAGQSSTAAAVSSTVPLSTPGADITPQVSTIPDRPTAADEELSEDEFDRIREAERALAAAQSGLSVAETVRKAAEIRARTQHRSSSGGGSGVTSGFSPKPDSVLSRPRPSAAAPPGSVESVYWRDNLRPPSAASAASGATTMQSPPLPPRPASPVRRPAAPLPSRPSSLVASSSAASTATAPPTAAAISAPLLDRIPSDEQEFLRPALVAPTVTPIPAPSPPPSPPRTFGGLQRRAAMHGRSDSGGGVAALVGRFEQGGARRTPPGRRPPPPPPGPAPLLQDLSTTIPTAPARLTPRGNPWPMSPPEISDTMPGGLGSAQEVQPPTPAKLYAAARRALRTTPNADFSTLPASPAEINNMLRRGSSMRRRPPPVPPRLPGRPTSMLTPQNVDGSSDQRAASGEVSEEEADEARREQIAFRRRTLPLPPPPLSPGRAIPSGSRLAGPRVMQLPFSVPDVVAEEEPEDAFALGNQSNPPPVNNAALSLSPPPRFPGVSRIDSGGSSVFLQRSSSSSSEDSIRGPEVLPTPPASNATLQPEPPPPEPIWRQLVDAPLPALPPRAESPENIPEASATTQARAEAEDAPQRGADLERRRTYTYTDLDVLLARLERARNGEDYDDLNVISEILGSARTSATAQGIMDELPVGRVEVLSRRVDKQGKVKQKLEVVGVRCNKCTVCMQQFRAEQLAVVLPCLHVYHTHCITSWLRRQHVCPVCREAVEAGMTG